MLALMYLLSCQEDEEDEEEIEDPLDLTEEEFINYFRVNKEKFHHICEMLKKDLRPGTNGYSVELQVLSTLRLLGSGCDQEDIAEDDLLQLSQSTVSRNLNKVIDALSKILEQQIKFPMTDQEQDTVKKGFYNKCEMPNVLGVIDCVHIEILKPNVSDHANYISRKGTYTINVLLACDADGLITNVVARWPGAVNDSHVWINSELRSYLEKSNYSGYLLGDNSFSCDPWLVTPYPDPKEDFEIAFNTRIKVAMSVMERVSNNLKARFRCLELSNKGMIYMPEKTCRIITACCILHNITHARNRTLSNQTGALFRDQLKSRWPLIDLKDKNLTPSEQGLKLRNELALSFGGGCVVINVHSDLALRPHRRQNVETGNKGNSQIEPASNLPNDSNSQDSDLSRWARHGTYISVRQPIN